MRILHLTNHVQQIGNGIVNVAVDLACLQAQNGHDVAIASSGGEYETLLATYGVQHLLLDQSRTTINMVKAAWHYREIIQKFQPDIVHAHMMTGVVLAGLLRSNGEYSLVSTVHNEFQRSAVLMGLAERVIAVSGAVADSMVCRGISKHKLRVVANGTLGSPRHRPLSDYQPLPLHRPAIATVAGMYTRKGIIELIEAFEKIAPTFPQAHLYLIGDGPDRAMFTALVQSKAVANRIHFTGFQPEPQRYILATDIFVLASHCESFGLVLTEAREAGCAIIASDIDGIPETLDYGNAGLLVPPKDSQTLADTLAQLLSEPIHLQKWKYLAKQNLERFSANRVYEETMAVYSELVRNYTIPKMLTKEELLVSK